MSGQLLPLYSLFKGLLKQLLELQIASFLGHGGRKNASIPKQWETPTFLTPLGSRWHAFAI